MKFPISRRFLRRGKLPAAAAYENHAAWRRSAAADNTVRNQRSKVRVVKYVFLKSTAKNTIRIF